MDPTRWQWYSQLGLAQYRQSAFLRWLDCSMRLRCLDRLPERRSNQQLPTDDC